MKGPEIGCPWNRRPRYYHGRTLVLGRLKSLQVRQPAHIACIRPKHGVRPAVARLQTTAAACCRPRTGVRCGLESAAIPNNAIIRSHLAGEASETQSLIARRVGTLEAELVFMEDKFAATRAAGDEPDPATVDLYGRLADRQRRLADPLGWQRTPRGVTPSLADIAAEIQAARSQGDTP